MSQTTNEERAAYAVTRKPRPATLRKLERMREMRAAGKSWARIADEFGCTTQAIFEMGKRWGLR
jgi:hypothetical protein